MTKTAVVTGASSGIGAATAHALAQQGFTVFAGARRVERLPQTPAITPLKLDVTDAPSVAAFCE